MKINSDINILGGLPDFELVKAFFEQENSSKTKNIPTTIKTKKSVERFEKAINSTILNFVSEDQKEIVKNLIIEEGVSADSRLMLFWNASFNNELLEAINSNIFFPAYYSGRLILKQGEVAAFLKELKEDEVQINKWSDSTIETTASKYLTLLKKFNLLEGSSSKSIKPPFLNDKIFILFIYWLLSIEDKTNILSSKWIQYSFSEKNHFVERILQKSFSKFIEVNYTGDKLQVFPLIEYTNIYDVITQS